MHKCHCVKNKNSSRYVNLLVSLGWPVAWNCWEKSYDGKILWGKIVHRYRVCMVLQNTSV